MIRTTTRPPLIVERHHPQINRIRRLSLREERERTGLFYIEGMRFIMQALHHQTSFETLVVCQELLTHSFAQQLTRIQQKLNVPLLEVSSEVMKSISQVQDSQGIGAVVLQRWQRLEQARAIKKLCWLAVETLHSPGNLGTILRTSDAVGGAGVMFFGDSTDPHDPGTVRASMGALFTQRFVRTSIQEFMHWKRRGQCMLVGTSPTAAHDYHKARYTAPIILFIGEERKGLSPEIQTICDLMVSIPMVGESDSLNVAMATSVMLYELFNQQRTK